MRRTARGNPQKEIAIIAAYNENEKNLSRAMQMWVDLKNTLEKQAARKKLPAQEVENRAKQLDGLGKELQALKQKNSPVKTAVQGDSADPTMHAIAHNQRRGL